MEGEVFQIPARISPSEIEEARQFIASMEKVSGEASSEKVLDWIVETLKLVNHNVNANDARTSFESIARRLQRSFPAYVFCDAAIDALVSSSEGNQQWTPAYAHFDRALRKVYEKAECMVRNCQRIIEAAERFKAEAEERRKADEEWADRLERQKAITSYVEGVYGPGANIFNTWMDDPLLHIKAFKGTKWEGKYGR